MNLKAQKTYKYFYETAGQGNDVKIERICSQISGADIAYATSESVGDMGPFTMTFNAETGDGIGQYTGTHLEEYAEGEVHTDTYTVTFKHNKPCYKDHTVEVVNVVKGEDMMEEFIEAAQAEGCIFASDGYNSDPISFKQLN